MMPGSELLPGLLLEPPLQPGLSPGSQMGLTGLTWDDRALVQTMPETKGPSVLAGSASWNEMVPPSWVSILSLWTGSREGLTSHPSQGHAVSLVGAPIALCVQAPRVAG